MPVLQSTDTKQQIIERLDAVPVENLRSVLEYVTFLSLDEEAKTSLLEHERDAIQEALHDPRPDLPDSEVRKMLEM